MRCGEFVRFRRRASADPNGWSRPLHRLRKNRETGDFSISPIVRNSFLAPGFVNDVDAFGEQFSTLLHRAAESVITGLLEPAAHTKIKPAVTEHIDHGIVFGQADWIV